MIHSSWLPCTALFLLLLLLSPSLLRAGSLQHNGPGWKVFHHLGKGSRNYYHRHGPGAWQRWQQRKAKNECQGIFDLYFILDNPNMRMSFVLYCGHAETLMPLTGDRKKIHEGLRKLLKVVPKGHKYMQEGFKVVNEQITKVNSGGKNVASMIIALMDGLLEKTVFKETKEQADKARSLGAIVYTVGVLGYNKYQMMAVADSPNHMFGVDTGFKGLKGIVEPLASKACIEVTSVETSTLCAGEPYETLITGKGFQNAKSKDQIICRFQFSENIHIVISDVPFDLRYLALLPLVILIPLLLYCCWRVFCKPEEPPPPEPEKEPEEKPPPPPPPPPPPINTCPTVIVSCCGCGPRVIERRCSNVALMKPPCGRVPCSSRIVLQPNRECYHFTRPPCSPKICLSPSRECFPIPQELCTSGICLQPTRECLSMPQTVCAPRICLKPSKDCLSLNNYPQCQHLPPKYSQSPFSMLPLLPPSARKSIESLGHPYRPHPTSKRPKTKD
ncbi:Anthrax toxin receptor-like [Sciurus carolinensis]|uniref:Anthrax toxin receptor-like n=1 Tax=Sciurus carolinensis TaxID=30640 RepID=A0AA41MW01_SCICA|nr:Anthrax toxin receptor-like [Sciurus carolinensis]